MTSALLASQICVTTVLSLAKQRVNCPHACKINNMKGMNTFYLLLNYYRLLPMNKYAILFTRPDLHSPLHAAYRETEISRYHFYDLPVPNGQGINRATVSVLPCPHQTREMVKWWCWSGTMWGYKWRVPGLQTVVWKAGPILIAATACAGSFPAFRPQLSTACALITIDHCKSSYIDNIRRWCLPAPSASWKNLLSAIAKILNWFLNFKCNCL